MDFKLEKKILRALKTDFERWDYLREKNFDFDLCLFTIQLMEGEIYLLKILEGTRYSVDFAERIIHRLYSGSILRAFSEMVYYHSQKLFWIAAKRLNLVLEMKKRGMRPEQMGILDLRHLEVCA